MKKVLSILAITGALVACNNAQEAENTAAVEPNATEETVVEYEYFGDTTMTADGAIPSTELLAYMGDADEMDVKVSGTINEVCQKKGCWMNVKLNDESTMHVSYDYEFLLPLNSAGQEIIMQGTAFYDTISVDHLRHLAEDAGKSEEEINSINEPKPTLAYLATGVMIKK